jgi:hypothetical protein
VEPEFNWLYQKAFLVVKGAVISGDPDIILDLVSTLNQFSQRSSKKIENTALEEKVKVN